MISRICRVCVTTSSPVSGVRPDLGSAYRLAPQSPGQSLVQKRNWGIEVDIQTEGINKDKLKDYIQMRKSVHKLWDVT